MDASKLKETLHVDDVIDWVMSLSPTQRAALFGVAGGAGGAALGAVVAPSGKKLSGAVAGGGLGVGAGMVGSSALQNKVNDRQKIAVGAASGLGGLAAGAGGTIGLSKLLRLARAAAAARRGRIALGNVGAGI